MPRLLLLLLIGLLSLGVAACGDDDEDTARLLRTSPPPPRRRPPTRAIPPRSSSRRTATLTVGTDKPAFPPYFEDDDPANGKGFESAVAYAIADKLGLDQVEWTVVPFNASFAPGPKDFDFDINQISITPKRAERVDFSDPYYTAPQAVIALKDSPAADADVARRPQGRQARRPDRHDEPRRGDGVDPAVEPAAGVQRLQRHGARAQDQARRRDRRRPADGLLPHRGRGAGGEDRRPVRRAGRRRLGRRAREGLAADGLREPGARRSSRRTASCRRSRTSGWAARPARPNCNRRPPSHTTPRRAGSSAPRPGRRRSRRQTAIAAVSTVLVIGLLITAIVTSKGWESVQEAFFDWDDFKASFPEVAKGFWLDIKMFVVIEIAVLIVGLVVALARISRPPRAVPAAAPRGRLHQRLPRRPDDPRRLPDRVRRPRARALRPAHGPDRAGRHRARARLQRLRGRGLPRRASSPCTRASARPRSPAGSPRPRRCATSCSRRRCAASRRRCSTTSSRCRRTSRSSSILGPLEAFRVAQIEACVELHLHAARRRRRCSTCASRSRCALLLDRWERRRRR